MKRRRRSVAGWPRSDRRRSSCATSDEAAEAERLAKESGVPEKSAAVIRALERRWREFLTVHGAAYEYEETVGPTIELAVHFQVR